MNIEHPAIIGQSRQLSQGMDLAIHDWKHLSFEINYLLF